MSQALAVLVLVVRDRKYALPLAGVAEVMRPLPLRPLADVPPYVLGVATIRGRAVPVVDPGRLVDGQPGSPRRFVTVAAAGRPVALAVEDVVGVRQLSPEALAGLPRLLAGAAAGALAGVSAADGEIWALLEPARLLPAGLAEAGA